VKQILPVLILLVALLVATPCLAEPAPDTPAPGAAAAETSGTQAAPADAKPESWFKTSTLTEKLAAVQWYTWLVIAALIALAAALLRAGKVEWDSRILAYAAMTVAISFVLSAIRLYRMAQGGSVTLVSMLPIIAFSLAFGPLRGALVGCAYGFLQLLHDPYIVHPLQVLTDYPLAFAALALGGLAERMPLPAYLKLPAATVIGSAGRFAMAVLSGVVFFAEYAGDQNVLVYSSLYNISYLGPDALMCLVVTLIPGVSRIVDVLRAAPRAGR
jgi:thiamine transporter